MPQDATRRAEREASYRRGWQQGFTEATEIVLRLVELGYERRKIRQLLAIYDDHVLSPWRATGDLERREPFPLFDLERLEELAATQRGYDWLLKEP